MINVLYLVTPSSTRLFHHEEALVFSAVLVAIFPPYPAFLRLEISYTHNWRRRCWTNLNPQNPAAKQLGDELFRFENTAYNGRQLDRFWPSKRERADISGNEEAAAFVIRGNEQDVRREYHCVDPTCMTLEYLQLRAPVLRRLRHLAYPTGHFIVKQPSSQALLRRKHLCRVVRPSRNKPAPHFRNPLGLVPKDGDNRVGSNRKEPGSPGKCRKRISQFNDRLTFSR